MNISELYLQKNVISFEVFPPKTEEGMYALFSELEKINLLNPDFFSITYGAGGSTQEKTLKLALDIRNRFGRLVLVHFTCVGSSRIDIKNYLHEVKLSGINNILALRGDPPAGQNNFVKPVNGFSYANELIEYINSIESFDIAVAGYPEGHPEAVSIDEDIFNLKKKVDAGGKFVLTQLFFDNSVFYEYIKKVEKSGITIPVIPGIMPIISKNQVNRVIDICKTNIPKELKSVINSDISDLDLEKYGIEFSVRQCEDLRKNGVESFHFYPLNKSKSITQIINSIK